jgi:hypothetical protein
LNGSFSMGISVLNCMDYEMDWMFKKNAALKHLERRCMLQNKRLNIEFNSLGKRQTVAVIQGVGLSAHVSFPSI